MLWRKTNSMKLNRTKIIKGALTLTFAFVALLIFAYPKLSAAILDEFKEYPTGDKAKMILDDPEKKRSSAAGDKGITYFNHEHHAFPKRHPQYKDSCIVCHHTNSKNLTKAMEEGVRRCDDCHKTDDSTCEFEGTNDERKFKGLNALNAKDAYHGTDRDDPNFKLAGCINCHKERDIFPVGCNECHSSDKPEHYDE